MKYAWGKANVLLELLLNPSSPGTLFKDHLLVHFILPKGVDRNQVRSGKTERFRTPSLDCGSYDSPTLAAVCSASLHSCWCHCPDLLLQHKVLT